MNPSGLCKCGCGETTNTRPYSVTARGIAKGDHYEYVNGHWRRGKPLKTKTPFERVMDKVEPQDDGCWLWTGRVNVGGYGSIQTGTNTKGKPRPVHRVVYEALVGPIPEGLTLDHLCFVKRCVNPDHLEPVTRGENARRARVLGMGGRQRQPHCRRGHAFTPENTYNRPNGQRTCRACLAEYRKRRREGYSG